MQLWLLGILHLSVLWGVLVCPPPSRTQTGDPPWSPLPRPSLLPISPRSTGPPLNTRLHAALRISRSSLNTAQAPGPAQRKDFYTRAQRAPACSRQQQLLTSGLLVVRFLRTPAASPPLLGLQRGKMQRLRVMKNKQQPSSSPLRVQVRTQTCLHVWFSLKKFTEFILHEAHLFFHFYFLMNSFYRLSDNVWFNFF